MRVILACVFLLTFCLQDVTAQSWNFLRFYTPSNSVGFTSLSGDMIVPAAPNPNRGTPYLWPGLQDISITGVFQSVLDGRSNNPNYIAGQWYMANGWCCENPSLPWGPGGFHGKKGDSIHFTYNRSTTTPNWDTTLVLNNQPSTKVVDSFPLAYKSFNQVLFAIELYDQAWNFGSLVFKNVVITTNSTDTSWCTK
ncbi:hypothetical protein HYALB_00005237 [Hymenoscyphus albidus]|uniref:Uncharacterized protein n=1 Tax=Hymenoscyphus albidus TaxID=595503 RepID=A0A9N9Q413_9HELO|nr:hypothetical protein HYALB_00005237 [Hymenoscyphus albidus]